MERDGPVSGTRISIPPHTANTSMVAVAVDRRLTQVDLAATHHRGQIAAAERAVSCCRD